MHVLDSTPLLAVCLCTTISFMIVWTLITWWHYTVTYSTSCTWLLTRALVVYIITWYNRLCINRLDRPIVTLLILLCLVYVNICIWFYVYWSCDFFSQSISIHVNAQITLWLPLPALSMIGSSVCCMCYLPMSLFAWGYTSQTKRQPLGTCTKPVRCWTRDIWRSKMR